MNRPTALAHTRIMASEEETLRAALREVADLRDRVAEDEEARTVAALRANLATLGPVEIGQLLGRSREWVRKVRVAHGIPARRKGRRG